MDVHKRAARPGIRAGWAIVPAALVMALSVPAFSCDDHAAHAEVPEEGATPARAAAVVNGASAQDGEMVRLVSAYTTSTKFPVAGEDAVTLSAWRKHAPYVRPVSIVSSADGKKEQSLYFDSGSKAKKPLVVVLHSWSNDFRQNISIPYAVFAKKNDWVFIHPNFRGPYRRPEACASELVVQDILDAVSYATKNANVDPDRIYLAGFSGGGMTALAMAGRHPELWAGVVAWAPVFDLADWHAYNRESFPKRRYAKQIAASCGGDPLPGTPAETECRRRSPSALLEKAREAGVPVYVATGIRDDIVPPDHALRAFNELAAPEDRISDADLAFVRARHALPPALAGAFASDLYERAGAPLVFERTSGRTTTALFAGRHEVVYNAGLEWLGRQRRP